MQGDIFFQKLATKPPFTRLAPPLAAFFKDYFTHEKVIQFGSQYVINTNFPPFPSPAFHQLVDNFSLLGAAQSRRLYSVTLAVTNRCSFNCWHCYNAGRRQTDNTLAQLAQTIRSLQDLGAVVVTLTGGEPLLRADLEDIVGAFDARSCVILGTTGSGLTPERATRLKDKGLFAVGISLDSTEPAEHDRMRGHNGAFQTALQAIDVARKVGLYPYVVSVATRQFLERERFYSFLRFARQVGALEVHLLEPCATGKLAGKTEVLLTGPERKQLEQYQRDIARDESLPLLSSLAYLESPEAFGCGAGLTHLYIDGSGEVCPCNLVPISFGNIHQTRLEDILQTMGQFFQRPRTGCIGRILARHLVGHAPPTPPDVSRDLCRQYLPVEHPVPRFFQLLHQQPAQVGQEELKMAYNQVHGDYDGFWISEAAKPIHKLMQKIPWQGSERVFEAGCGTGYATALLSARAREVVAVDISEGMISEARRRLASLGLTNAKLVLGDALAELTRSGQFDLVFTSWVLGYIPLAPFFTAAGHALGQGGRLGLIVHRENSPREALELFAELVAEDPLALQKSVAFDFPPDRERIASLAAGAGLRVCWLHEGKITFRYDSPQQVLDHLLKSGAGTAFYEAIDPAKRPALTERFLTHLRQRHPRARRFSVQHDYFACLAEKL